MSRRHVLAALALACTMAPAAAQTPPRIVTWNCSGCHGLDGNTTWPQVPRLSGQNATYLADQIRAFQLAPAVHAWQVPTWIAAPAVPAPGARVEPASQTFMIGMAKSIGEDEARSAAAWYAAQRPGPGRAGDASVVERGREIFLKGAPTAGVIACQDCHGTQGQGLGDFPRLAGQNADYTVRQLVAFRAGTRGHSPTMKSESKALTDEQMRDVAVWLQAQP